MASGMAIWMQLLVMLAVQSLTHSQQDIRVPPNIFDPDRPKSLYYSEGKAVAIPCQANGQPRPTFQWMYNGTIIVSDEFKKFDTVTGTLTLPNLSRREEGLYMCIASIVFDNTDGGRITAASFSPPLSVYQTRIQAFTPAPNTQLRAAEFSYVRLVCANKGEIVANDTAYNWYESQESKDVNLDGGRLYIDQTGDLHFSYVTRNDQTNNFRYLCGVSSPSDKIIRLGNINLLTVDPVTNPASIKPQLQYSNGGIKGIRFSSARLECVFSGYDPAGTHLPVTHWYDDAGNPIISNGKFLLSNDRRSMTVTNIQEQDERNYYCQAETSAGKTQQTAVFLDVTSAPIFLERGAPMDQTVPEDMDVIFKCDARSASSEPAPSAPVWYINGNRNAIIADHKKYQLSDGDKQLTIKAVKKATDILCVQCEVKNAVGTTWGDGCLNVLLPIKIINQPQLRQEIAKGDSVDLTVVATCDPAVTLAYRWEHNNQSYTDAPPFVVINPSNNVAYLNTSGLTDEQFEQIGGKYRRIIYHTHETKVVEIEVVLKGAPPAAGQAAEAGVDMWIIGLIIGLIFLIIVIIIIIFVICRKQQEGDYNVDKKETGAGLDPEKELKDKGFNDYSRPANDDYANYPDKKPPGDLEYDDVPIGGDDESLGEYGDEDDTHFNEDGSFIGIYQKKAPPPPPSQTTESTI